MEANQSFFRKYGLLMSTILLFGTIVGLHFFDNEKDEVDQWPCYKISLTMLKEIYNDDGTIKNDLRKMDLFTTIDDASKPITSMSLWESRIDNSNTSTPLRNMTKGRNTPYIPNLKMGYNDVLFEYLKPVLFSDDGTGRLTWKTGLSYLQFTPSVYLKESQYMAYTIEGMDARNIGLGGALQSNPVPPGRPQ